MVARSRAPRRWIAAHVTVPILSVAALLLGSMVGGGIVYAAAPSPPSNVIHACKNKKTGALRVVGATAKCHTGESPLEWNQQGPAGLPGTPAPSNGYHVQGFVWLMDTTPKTIASLTLPAGSYLLLGHAELQYYHRGGCGLAGLPAGKFSPHSSTPTNDAGDQVSIPVPETGVVLPSGGTVSVQCATTVATGTPPPRSAFARVDFIAIQVGTLHES